MSGGIGLSPPTLGAGGPSADNVQQAREQQVLADMIGYELRAKTARSVREAAGHNAAGTAGTAGAAGAATHASATAHQQETEHAGLQDFVDYDAGRDSHGSVRAAVQPAIGMQVTGTTVAAAAAAAQHAVEDKVKSPSTLRIHRASSTDAALASDGDDGEDDMGWAHFDFADASLAGGDDESQHARTARDRDVGMQSLLETESHPLVIMQFSESGTSIMRTDLTRADLLEVCRNDIDPHRQHGASKKMSKNTSIGQLAELERTQPSHTRSQSSDAYDAASLANLHLRDLRYLQGINDHHLMPRSLAVRLSRCLSCSLVLPRSLSVSLFLSSLFRCVWLSFAFFSPLSLRARANSTFRYNFGV